VLAKKVLYLLSHTSSPSNFFFFFVLEFELGAYTLSHSETFFVMGFLETGSPELFAWAAFKP
jgi:hypothetical protein